MRGEQSLRETIIQNLKDSGCNKKFIDEFLELYDKNDKDKIFKLLSKHRSSLLNSIHKGQHEIDNLDYLIHSLKQDNK